MTSSSSQAVVQSSFFQTAELSRVMVPSDANVAGNVHGGTILQMIEESAAVAARRFFHHHNNNSDSVIKVLTARVESVTFQKPLHVGDVAKVQARVVFSSPHTVAVAVKLVAERLTSPSADTVCNQALLWVLGVVPPENHQDNELVKDRRGIATVRRTREINIKDIAVAKAPPLDPPTDAEGQMAYQLAKMAYKKRKAHQHADPASLPDNSQEEDASQAADNAFTPAQSAVELAQVMLPSDCVTGSGLVSGGVVMKLIDNAAGVVAVRHCGTNVVTISVDAMDLVAPVLIGDVLKIRARAVFSSGRSLEIQASVVAERFTPTADGKLEREEIVSTSQAYYTFVSLGRDGKVQPMRPLAPQSSDEKQSFLQGKGRYLLRKALRSGDSRK